MIFHTDDVSILNVPLFRCLLIHDYVESVRVARTHLIYEGIL